MSALTGNSIALAQVLGIVFLVGGLNAVFWRKSMSAAIEGVSGSPALFWVWGFINLLFGAAIVALHGGWPSDWSVIITIIGWAGVLKGALLMFFPDFSKSLYRKSNTPAIIMLGGIVAILLGIVFLYAALSA